MAPPRIRFGIPSRFYFGILQDPEKAVAGLPPEEILLKELSCSREWLWKVSDLDPLLARQLGIDS